MAAGDAAGFVSLADIVRAHAAARIAPDDSTVHSIAVAECGQSAMATPSSTASGAGAAARVSADESLAFERGAASFAGERASWSGEPNHDDSGRAESACAVREARLFRAALADALDARLALLVRELAGDVLMRELRLGPVDVAALARRLIGERSADEPLRLRVACADGDVVCDIPTVVDPCLEPGDAILECRAGDVDARLTVRLAAVLARIDP